MLQAYKKGFYGPHLVWLLRGWYTDQWWEVPDVKDCSPREIKQSAGNYLGIDEVILSKKEVPTVFKLVSVLNNIFNDKSMGD